MRMVDILIHLITTRMRMQCANENKDGRCGNGRNRHRNEVVGVRKSGRWLVTAWVHNWLYIGCITGFQLVSKLDYIEVIDWEMTGGLSGRVNGCVRNCEAIGCLTRKRLIRV